MLAAAPRIYEFQNFNQSSVANSEYPAITLDNTGELRDQYEHELTDGLFRRLQIFGTTLGSFG